MCNIFFINFIHPIFIIPSLGILYREFWQVPICIKKIMCPLIFFHPILNIGRYLFTST